jgi:hypothetical protein
MIEVAPVRLIGEDPAQPGPLLVQPAVDAQAHLDQQVGRRWLLWR